MNNIYIINKDPSNKYDGDIRITKFPDDEKFSAFINKKAFDKKFPKLAKAGHKLVGIRIATKKSVEPNDIITEFDVIPY